MQDRPICPHAEHCGGCKYQGTPYAEQLKIKERESLALFEEKGLVPAAYGPIVASPETYEYRNKMEYSFGDFEKDGEMTLGLHPRKRFMSVLTTDRCQIVPEDFNTVLRAVLDHCLEKGYRHYHRRRHDGFLRTLIIRRGVATKELLIALVTTSEETLDEGAFVETILSLVESDRLSHKIAGILHITDDNISDALHIESQKTLYGRDFYEERLLDLTFRVGIASFFQGNVPAIERLYTDAVNLIKEYDNKTVFDLFCGTGTITQVVAKRAKMAVGVEIVPEAVAMAKESAAQNGMTNCRFHEGDVFAVLDEVTEKPDVIIVDPPRPGIGVKTMTKIVSYGVPEIVYVSCNPKTLAQDLLVAKEYGYELAFLQFYDNFPFTKHVEAVTLLSRSR